MSYCPKLSLLTCAFCLSLASPPAYAAKTAAPPAKNWTGMIMTALVVTSTVGGIAYSLGYGKGRNQSSDVSSGKMPQPPTAVPQVVLATNVIQFEAHEEAELATAPSPEEIFPPSIAPNNTASDGVASKTLSPETSPSETSLSQTSLSETSLSETTVSETTRMVKVDIITELIQDLQSPDPSKRRKAIWDLGQQGDSRAVQPMVDLMMSSDSSQRSLILAAVSEIGIKTLKPVNRALMMSLQDGSSDVRKNSIRDVTRIYDLVGQVSQLLQHATGDSDPEVQETASWALSQLNRIRPSAMDDKHRLPSGLSFKELESAGEKAEG